MVLLPKSSQTIPTGKRRDELSVTHQVWINCDASEEVVKNDVAQACGWHPDDVQYLYAQGKNVRLAKLSDIENAWDAETMGSGALYVSQPARK